MQHRSGLDSIRLLTEVTLSPVEAAHALETPPEEMRRHLERLIAQKQQEIKQLTFRLEDLNEELGEPPTSSPTGGWFRNLLGLS